MNVPREIESRLRRVSSRQNALVKDLRKALSQGEPSAEGYLAVEGVRMIEEAIRSGLRFQAVFFSEAGSGHATRLLPQIGSQVEVLLLPDEVFASAVSTESPQGVAAMVKLRPHKFEDLLESAHDSLLVGVAGIQDPGNLGTIIRSAEAFAARAVLLGEKTVSHFNPKAVRGSAGSIFREPLIRVKLGESVALLKEQGVRVLATSSHKGKPLHEANFTGAALIVIGNEGAGVPPEILSLADELVTIPHSQRVESLNAGIAASILLYEAARQRGAVAAPKRSFELIDQYARKQHLCFLTEMFLNRTKTEYILCFRPTEAANNPDRYACRYLQLEIGTVETLEQATELNESTRALLGKELANLKSST